MWDGELSWRKLSVTGVLILVLALASAIAGATLVPALANPLPTKANEPPPAVIQPEPSVPATPSSPVPTTTPRPFAQWAAPLAGKLQIPQVALESYGYAEWVLQQTRPTCKLQWTTLAAIGKLASDHGRQANASLDPSGRMRPPLVGPALGLADTDAGALDGDAASDHAVGPMQMLPSMWRSSGVDADGDDLADPQDIDDAALSAGYFLCASGKDLTNVDSWKAAIASYPGMQVDKVFETAQGYGVGSKA